MAAHTTFTWPTRIVTFLLAALAAASAVAWGLRLSVPMDAHRVAPVASSVQPSVDGGAVAQALGAMPAVEQAVAAPLQSARFSLLGVVAGSRETSAALISVDGQPAKRFLLGATVADNWVLRAVKGRQAMLAPASSVANNRLGGDVQGGDQADAAPYPADLVLDMPPLAPLLSLNTPAAP